MIGTGYSFFFQESHWEVQEYINTERQNKRNVVVVEGKQ